MSNFALSNISENSFIALRCSQRQCTTACHCTWNNKMICTYYPCPFSSWYSQYF